MNNSKDNLDHAVYPGEKIALFFSLVVLLFLGWVMYTIRPSLLVITILGSLIYIRGHQGQLLGNSALVTATNYSKVNTLVEQACKALQIDRPRVHIIQDPYLNAYAIGFVKPFTVVIHSSILESFTDEELLFIIGHELTHIKRRHTMWLSIIAPFGRTLPVFDLIFNFWQRRCEYTCDRMGLIVCQNLDASIKAMIKISSGAQALKHTNHQEFVKQSLKVKSKRFDSWSEILGTHPYITNRVTKLNEFYRTSWIAQREAASAKAFVVIPCKNPECNARLRVPDSDKPLLVTCPKCKTSFRFEP